VAAEAARDAAKFDKPCDGLRCALPSYSDAAAQVADGGPSGPMAWSANPESGPAGDPPWIG
jgi:hypothetical protein